MIVLKYQDSTTEKFFENARRNLSFWGWMGGQQTFKKIGSGPNMEDSPNLYFMFFDRYEIQIQPCVLFSNGKCIICQSSSPQKILRATPSAAGPHSREEGCVVVAMLR